MSKMRILLATNELTHYRLAVFNELGRRDGVELTVLHSGKPQTGHCQTFREMVTTSTSRKGFYWQHGLLQAARRHDVLIAMFDLHWLSNMSLPLLPSRLRNPVVLWGHGYGDQRWVDPVRRWFARRADAVLLYDEVARKRFIAEGLPASQFFVAPNTIHVERPVYDPEHPKADFLFVGRLRQEKRIDLLVQAFADAVPQMRDSTRLSLVGAGGVERDLRDLVVARGIADRVDFHGPVLDEDQLEPFFRRAIAYVSPGHVGLGVLHSFAYGVPVITEKDRLHAPEVANIQHGVNGFLVQDRPGLVRVMQQLADDAPLRRTMGQRAFDHYTKRRTLSQMVDGMLEAVAAAQRHYQHKVASPAATLMNG